MQKLLYLDTARLGQMSPRACRASVDFACFASEYGGSLYFTDFLSRGSHADEMLGNFPHLADWQGIDRFKSAILEMAGSRDGTECLVAARSSTLMKFAARVLAGVCRNVLLTDLCWPSYERIAANEQERTNSRLTRLRLRSAIFERRFNREQLVDFIADQFVEQRCDGLFLPLVDNLGIHLPVAKIVTRIQQQTELRLVVIDAAQAINQVSIESALCCCDIMIAGCHKWIEAFNPLGIALYGNPGSKEYVRDSMQRLCSERIIDDPLMTFTKSLESSGRDRFGETVSAAPLITANAAIRSTYDQIAGESLEENRCVIADLAAGAGWRLFHPHSEFSSRIMLLKSSSSQTQNLKPDALCRKFLEHGVALTAYRQGLVRISLPTKEFDESELALLKQAFAASR